MGTGNGNDKINRTLIERIFNTELEKREEEQTKTIMRNILIGCIITTVVTLLGTWTVWNTIQTMQVKYNKEEIIEIQEQLEKNEERFTKFREEFLTSPKKK
jgi:thermostable 8-oxoguanine DNA glycosylase